MATRLFTKDDKTYYDNQGKVQDFFIGFLGYLALNILTSIYWIIISMFNAGSSQVSEIIFSIVSIFTSFIIPIICIVYTFKIQRKWISYGIIGFFVFFCLCCVVLFFSFFYVF